MATLNVPGWMRYNPFAMSFATPIAGVFGSGAKVPFWAAQTKKIPTKVPLPSLTTTAKVAGTGAIVYTGYKGVQGVGKTFDDFFGTGKTKKETKAEGGDGIFPSVPAGTYIYQAAAEPQGFFGGLGSGIGAGAEGVGSGVGSGLGMAIPVLAIGGLAYILLKEKRKRK